MMATASIDVVQGLGGPSGSMVVVMLTAVVVGGSGGGRDGIGAIVTMG